MSKINTLRPEVSPVSFASLMELLPGAAFVTNSVEIEPEELQVSGVSVDSNDMDPGWIFVGIPGGKHGASFAARAAELGATVLVTDEAGATYGTEANLPTLIVRDPRNAAAILADGIYGPIHSGLPIVGVTGTNGKTTTTYLVRAALGAPSRPVALMGTLEVSTGKTMLFAERTTHESPVVQRALALSVQEGSKAAVVEVSSHALAMNRVDGIHFAVGLFTNLQHDHLDFHGNMDSYLAAKAKLFEPERADQGIIAVDDEYGRRLVRDSEIPVQAIQVLSDDQPDIGDVPLWKAVDIVDDAESGGSRFTLVDPSGKAFEAVCPLPGPANVQDAALAIITAKQLGLSVEQAIQNVASAPPIDGRSMWIKKPNALSPAVIVDSCHTPEAVEVFLEVVRPLTRGRIIAVFGTDGDRDATKRAPLAQVFAKEADVLLVTDENPRTEDAASIRQGLLQAISTVRPDMQNVFEVPEGRQAAIQRAVRFGSSGDLVVITGKGGERVQQWGGEDIPFYDPDIAATVLSECGYEPDFSHVSPGTVE